jgi:hypothetical protein
MEGRIALWTGALAVVALVGATPTGGAGKDAADEVLTTIRPEAIRADMRFLADDLLEGRGTGTRGHEIAAKFIASEFEAMGLEPAGDNGTYFQRVPLRSIRPDEERTTMSIVRGRQERPLIFRRDFVAAGDAGRNDTSVEAPVVYVGFGVTAPEQSYDDYAGVEVKGKIVAYLYGAPARFESTMRAHYSSGAAKAANAAAHGALGTIFLDSPDLERVYPFKERVSDLAFPYMRWLDARGQPNDYFPALRGSAILSMDATARMFEGSGKSPEEIYGAAEEGRTFSLALPLAAKIKTISKFEDIHSPNVMAGLRGSDVKLRDENVVYSAHLDHLGIGDPVNGDKIYNGALDNASGSACLVEIARAYGQMRPRPRRSIIFLSVTAEEEGLLGSDYFAHYPPMSKDSLVADINMDGAALLWPIEDIVARGAEHSSLGVTVQEAAARLKIDVSADPSPEQVLFIRSDQYSFVKQGIPSLYLSPGLKSSNPKIKPAEIHMTWVATRYHKPQDDMDQLFDFDSGAKYARYSFLVGYILAQEDEKPAWNPGDFFDDHYGKKARNVRGIERLLSVSAYRDRLRN